MRPDMREKMRGQGGNNMAELLTLNAIRAHGPCESGWRKLLVRLGKTKADDAPLSMLAVLDSNGLDDALWCLRCIKGRDGAIRMLACDFAQEIAHFNADPRLRTAIDVARRHAVGDAADAELNASYATAYAAARDAVRDAAWAASCAVSFAVVWDAAEAAAWATAYAAAHAADGVAVREAAWWAAREASYGAQTAILRRWIIQQEAA